jgi:hypothetical protein
MIIRILNAVASSSSLLFAAVIAELISIYIMNQRMHELESYSMGPPPDVWLGCTESELYSYLESLGEDGRKDYLRMNTVDLCPYMWSYMILFGSLLVRQCNKANISKNTAMIFPLAMAMDLIESFTFRYATVQFPLHLGNELVLFASIANRLKWLGVGIGLTLLAVLFLKNLYSTKMLKSS